MLIKFLLTKHLKTHKLKGKKERCNEVIRASSLRRFFMLNTEKMMQEAKTKLSSGQLDGHGLFCVYDDLGEIVKAKPIMEAFKLFREGLKSDANKASTLSGAYRILKEIAIAKPVLRKQVMETFKEALKSDKNDESSLSDAYFALEEIIKIRPRSEYSAEGGISQIEQADKNPVLESFKEALKSDKNGRFSLFVASDVLEKVIENKPELGPEIFTIIRETLQSGKNGQEAPVNDGGALQKLSLYKLLQLKSKAPSQR